MDAAIASTPDSAARTGESAAVFVSRASTLLGSLIDPADIQLPPTFAIDITAYMQSLLTRKNHDGHSI